MLCCREALDKSLQTLGMAKVIQYGTPAYLPDGELQPTGGVHGQPEKSVGVFVMSLLLVTVVGIPACCHDMAGSLAATKELTTPSMIGGSPSQCVKVSRGTVICHLSPPSPSSASLNRYSQSGLGAVLRYLQLKLVGFLIGNGVPRASLPYHCHELDIQNLVNIP